ncbi:hypothetical protein PG996_000047 [Apiospora saccharicola]|uniref:Uncharacterized protein n=1 Tax=Apiospora saccharicola TaxID=335842 RepID=A0ABR1WCN6_9PEZI
MGRKKSDDDTKKKALVRRSDAVTKKAQASHEDDGVCTICPSWTSSMAELPPPGSYSVRQIEAPGMGLKVILGPGQKPPAKFQSEKDIISCGKDVTSIRSGQDTSKSERQTGCTSPCNNSDETMPLPFHDLPELEQKALESYYDIYQEQLPEWCPPFKPTAWDSGLQVLDVQFEDTYMNLLAGNLRCHILKISDESMQSEYILELLWQASKLFYARDYRFGNVTNRLQKKYEGSMDAFKEHETQKRYRRIRTTVREGGHVWIALHFNETSYTIVGAIEIEERKKGYPHSSARYREEPKFINKDVVDAIAP